VKIIGYSAVPFATIRAPGRTNRADKLPSEVSLAGRPLIIVPASIESVDPGSTETTPSKK
jgi:hypothetical protein